VQILPLAPPHRADWERLARAYKDFYQTPTTIAEFDAAWARLLAGDTVCGLAAMHDSTVVGIAHFVFHANVWVSRVCYLQDLFTTPAARGRGVATALIEAVARRAVERGAGKCYWMTHEQNLAARRLYDRVARCRGFIRYDYELASRASGRS